jgi:hypothetical protein
MRLEYHHMLILKIHITYGFYTLFFSPPSTRTVVISSWSGATTQSTVLILILKVQQYVHVVLWFTTLTR